MGHEAPFGYAGKKELFAVGMTALKEGEQYLRNMEGFDNMAGKRENIAVAGTGEEKRTGTAVVRRSEVCVRYIRRRAR